jgi:hypothetical protein
MIKAFCCACKQQPSPGSLEAHHLALVWEALVDEMEVA